MKIILDIHAAIRALKAGKIVAIPTETVYGLAGNGFQAQSILDIFKIKNRPHFDPLILHTSEYQRIFPWVKEFPEPALRLAQKFWPGPLTLLLRKEDMVPDLISSGSDWAGFRVPAHPLSLELLKALDFPLAAPSANPFGYISPTTAQHVADQLGDKIEGILDGGPCTIGIESTVVRVLKDQVEILRAGAISAEAIEACTGLPSIRVSEANHPTAPGMLKSHYAPEKEFRLLRDSDLISERKDIAFLLFQEYRKSVPLEQQFVLSPDGSLETAARNLFALMRELDQKEGISLICAEEVPDTGLGIAINDKLKKAAYRKNNAELP